MILGGRKNVALERQQQALAALEKVLELGDVDADYLKADPGFADRAAT